jgi:hypothetical protein
LLQIADAYNEQSLTSRCSEYFWIRSTGFPFELLDDIVALEDSDLLVRHEELLDRIHITELALLSMVKEEAPTAFSKLQRKFKEKASVGAKDMPLCIRDKSSSLFNQRQSDLDAASAMLPELQKAFDKSQIDNRNRLISALSSKEAREALFLSNPQSLDRVDALITTFTNSHVKLNSRVRQKLRLAWNYLQRLCAKNDTSSFFGPITWGRIDRQQHLPLQISTTPGPWLAQRKTFFEHWVLLSISRALCASEPLAPFIPMELSPGCHLQGDTLFYPINKNKPISGPALALLRSLQQAWPEGQSQQSLLSALSRQGYSPKDCVGLINFFLEQGVVQYRLQVPPGQTSYPQPPLQQLYSQLASLDTSTVERQSWLAMLDQLETQRQLFATGDLQIRQQALDNLTHILSSHGIDLTRSQGKMYVGRFPIYEDCGRNLQVNLGYLLADDLQQTMEPVIALHHWLTSAVAARLHGYYLDYWKTLSQGGKTVDFLQFYHGLQQQKLEQQVVEEVRQILGKSWENLRERHINSNEKCNEIMLQPQELQQLLDDLLEQEPRGKHFPSLTLRVHSPDFMIAAQDVEAIAQGNYIWVIGEVHPAVHTLSQPVAQPFCPYNKAISHEVNELLKPATARLADTPETYQRSHIDWLEVDSLYQVILPGCVGRVPPERCLPAGRGVVELSDDEGMEEILYYRDKQTGFRQDLITVIPTELHRICFTLAADLLGYGMSARVTCGRLILKRRSWDILPKERPTPGQPGENLCSYLDWRQWARQLGMPRHVFVKLSNEPKPIYVDFANPLSLDLLDNLCKSPQAMRFSEMRPSPKELWLRDSRGRYCSEFRTSFTPQCSED